MAGKWKEKVVKVGPMKGQTLLHLEGSKYRIKTSKQRGMISLYYNSSHQYTTGDSPTNFANMVRNAELYDKELKQKKGKK